MEWVAEIGYYVYIFSAVVIMAATCSRLGTPCNPILQVNITNCCPPKKKEVIVPSSEIARLRGNLPPPKNEEAIVEALVI